MIYGVDVVVFGGLYILIGNWTKDRHLAALQEGRSIRSLIAANNRKIAVITSSIRRDRSEALYDLEKYDDEISQMEQDLEETAKKKKDGMETTTRQAADAQMRNEDTGEEILRMDDVNRRVRELLGPDARIS